MGERVFMVLDATIRPTAQVGLQPGAGLKRFTVPDQPDGEMRGIVYADSAVVLQGGRGKGGWARTTGGQSSRRV